MITLALVFVGVMVLIVGDGIERRLARIIELLEAVRNGAPLGDASAGQSGGRGDQDAASAVEPVPSSSRGLPPTNPGRASRVGVAAASAAK